MRATLPKALVAILLLAWGGIVLFGGRAADETGAGPLRVPVEQRHYVTPRQLVAAGALTSHPVGPITGVAHDGRRRDWMEISGGQHVVAVFIKAGCPCNVEFEPFVQRLVHAYQGTVRFVGIIDGPVAAARRYAADNRVLYPVLADEQRILIGRFRVENGAYVALVRPDGVLDTLWPGYSIEMMRELGRRIAGCAEATEQPFDLSGLPGALTTGCPFAE